MKTLYLAWRAPAKRWYPIGRLTSDEAGYTFVYLHGAEVAANENSLVPLVDFPRFKQVYRSATLFPIFGNRLPPATRRDRAAFVEWLDLDVAASALDLLARSEGLRRTDTLQVFPHPVPAANGRYVVHAFVHGLRHRDPAAIVRAADLSEGDPLRLVAEEDNVADQFAVQARTSDGVYHLGYLPRYLAGDIHELGLDTVSASVERVNPPPAPVQFRVLCKLEAAWPPGFQPCSGPLFQPVPSGVPAG